MFVAVVVVLSSSLLWWLLLLCVPNKRATANDACHAAFRRAAHTHLHAHALQLGPDLRRNVKERDPWLRLKLELKVVKHCRRGGGGRGGGRRRFHCHRRRRVGEPPAAMAGGPTQVGAASLGSGARRERVHFSFVGMCWRDSREMLRES